MSLNNTLPWWVYEVQYEGIIAECSCCFKQEYYAGTSKVLPERVVKLSKATFGNWYEGSWNSYQAEKQKKFTSL